MFNNGHRRSSRAVANREDDLPARTVRLGAKKRKIAQGTGTNRTSRTKKICFSRRCLKRTSRRKRWSVAWKRTRSIDVNGGFHANGKSSLGDHPSHRDRQTFRLTVSTKFAAS